MRKQSIPGRFSPSKRPGYEASQLPILFLFECARTPGALFLSNLTLDITFHTACQRVAGDMDDEQVMVTPSCSAD